MPGLCDYGYLLPVWNVGQRLHEIALYIVNGHRLPAPAVGSYQLKEGNAASAFGDPENKLAFRLLYLQKCAVGDQPHRVWE